MAATVIEQNAFIAEVIGNWVQRNGQRQQYKNWRKPSHGWKSILKSEDHFQSLENASAGNSHILSLQITHKTKRI